MAQVLDSGAVYSRFPKQEYGRKKVKKVSKDKVDVIDSVEGKKPIIEIIKVEPEPEQVPQKVVAPLPTSPAKPVVQEQVKPQKKNAEKRTLIPKEYNIPETKKSVKKEIRKKWSLTDCVQYALENNLQVSSADLNRRMAELTLSQSQASRIPSLNGDMSVGNSYGRSIDPTSNQFVNKGFLFNNASLNSQVLLFGWFQKKNEIAKNDLSYQAADESYNQLKDDIALNVATGYLRVLLAREQVKIALEQLGTDQAQKNQTKQFVDAGKLPELNLAQMETQVASDSSSLISAITEEQLALLQLRALLNFSFDKEFDIESPNLTGLEINGFNNLPDAEGVYDVAMKNMHRVKSKYLNLLASRQNLNLMRALRYPSLYLGANISTSYSSNLQEITGQTYIGETNVGYVNVGGTQYPLTTPQYDFSRRTVPYFDQINSNVRSNVALTLNVPLFNGLNTKMNIERAKIGLVNEQIALESEQLNLRQDIYKAHLEAQAALQKYKAAASAQSSSRRALDFAIKRYNIGMLSTYEYTLSQNNYNQASSSALAAKYEMIFKLKVLDYYMGNTIKL